MDRYIICKDFGFKVFFFYKFIIYMLYYTLVGGDYYYYFLNMKIKPFMVPKLGLKHIAVPDSPSVSA